MHPRRDQRWKGREIALRLHDEGAEVFTVQRSADDRFPSIAADIADATEAQSAVDPFLMIRAALDHLRKTEGSTP